MFFNVIIAGGRDFNDYDLLKKSCDEIFQKFNLPPNTAIQIVEGECKGADKLGKKYGEEHDYVVVPFPAKWRPNGVYDKAAGFKRNKKMAQFSHMLIAFWDGKSKGTKHMIDLAYEYQMNVNIINY